MKKIMTALLALALIPLLWISAAAVENHHFLHSYYTVQQGSLTVLSDPLPEEGELSVFLASQPAPKVTPMTAAQAGLPTTVYCVVDTSTSMNRELHERQCRLLTALSEGLGEEDVMVITTVGKTIIQGQPLTTKAQREEAIAALTLTGEQPRLYEAVSMAVDDLTTQKSYTQNKCLVILATGRNDDTSSVTEQMALDKIANATIPVFAVGVQYNHPTGYAVSLAQTLERLAEASVGGVYRNTSQQGSEPELLAGQILEDVAATMVLPVHLSGIGTPPAGDVVQLVVRWETADEQYEDAISILTADILPHLSDMEETVAGEEENDSEEDSRSKILILAVAAVVVAAAVTAVILATRKKPQPPVYSAPIQQVPSTTPAEQPQEETISVEYAGAFPPPNDVSKERQLNVHLTVLGRSEQTFDFRLPEGRAVSLGRDDRSNVVLRIGDLTDTKLSGRHCVFQWDGSKVLVIDSNSTNGTFINGSQLYPGVAHLLENNGTLRVGSREYRVSMTEQE